MWDESLSGDSHDPSRFQWPLTTRILSRLGSERKEILTLRRRHLWARIASKYVRRVPFGRLLQSGQIPMAFILKANISTKCLGYAVLHFALGGRWNSGPCLALLPLRHRRGFGPGQVKCRVPNWWPSPRYQSPPVPKARKVECVECRTVCTIY